jgi:hypothetical protein
MANREALRVDYDGFSTPDLPARLLVLAPGRYRFAWREQATGSSERLSWRARCADAGRVIGQSRSSSDDMSPSGAWRTKTLDVEIPAEGCRGLWLELAAAPGERHAPGTLWSADMRLAPAP